MQPGRSNLWGLALLAMACQFHLGAGGGLAQSFPPARVVVAGVPYSGSPQPEVRDGIVWGPVAPVARMLGAEVSWDAATRTCTITTSDGRRLRVEAGGRVAQMDDRALHFAAPPVVAGGSLIAPLAPVLEALGTKVTWRPRERELQANALLRAVEVYGSEAGVAVRLVTSVPVTGKVEYLSNPERAFVDFAGLETAEPAGEHYLGTGGAWRVRWSRFQAQPAVARFVFDLQRSGDVRWRPSSDGGRLELGRLTGKEPPLLVERPRLEQVDLRAESERSSELLFRLSAPADWSWQLRAQPYRLVITLPDAVPDSLPAPVSSAQAPMRAVRAVEQGPWGVTFEVPLNWLLRLQIEENPGELRFVLRRDTVEGKVIVVDPGHGGRDPGATYRGLREKDINLEVALTLVSQLQSAGAQAVVTRDSDVFVALPDRPAVATALRADAFVSIHCNAMPRPNMNHGTETYYHTPQSQMLAHVLQHALVSGLGRRDNGVRQRRFAVLWPSPQPSALVELMYMDWDAEYTLLQNPETRQRAARALFEGIRGYFEGLRVAY